jgi:ADP-ribosylation factor-like protein 2
MKRVIGEDHHEISPTVGFNIKTLEFQSYILNMWDIGGQKSIRTYWRNYFEQTDGIIWVVDSVDRFRMEECRDQLREILMQEVMRRLRSSDLRCPFHSCEKCLTLQKLAGATLLVFANKQDLGGALDFPTIASILDLSNEDISGRHYRLFACSAMDGTGLIEGFEWLVNDISSRIFIMS